MMGLRHAPKYFGEMIYQLSISFVIWLVMVIGSYAASLEFIINTYWPIWLLTYTLYALNIPVLSALLASFYDSGRWLAVIGIALVLIYAIVGVMWANSAYNNSTSVDVLSAWWGLIPGMSPVVCTVLMS